MAAPSFKVGAKRAIHVAVVWSRWIYKHLTREESFVLIALIIFAFHIILFKRIPYYVIVCLYLLSVNSIFRGQLVHISKLPRQVRKTIGVSLYLQHFVRKSLPGFRAKDESLSLAQTVS